jgi:glutamate synthase (NADPH/NADH) small chain
MGLKLDDRGNVAVNNYQTSNPWVFAAGDTVHGPSLVVTAIDTGRKTAAAIDQWLRKGS